MSGDIGCIATMSIWSKKKYKSIIGTILVSPVLEKFEENLKAFTISIPLFIIMGKNELKIPFEKVKSKLQEINPQREWYPNLSSMKDIINIKRVAFYKKIKLFVSQAYEISRMNDNYNNNGSVSRNCSYFIEEGSSMMEKGEAKTNESTFPIEDYDKISMINIKKYSNLNQTLLDFDYTNTLSDDS